MGFSPASGSSMSCSKSPGLLSSVKKILSSECGMWTTKCGSPSTARQETQHLSYGSRRNGRGGERKRVEMKVGVHAYFPTKREPNTGLSAEASLYSNRTVRVDGLPEDEKVKMLGNMPAKERGTVLVREWSNTFLGTLRLLASESPLPRWGLNSIAQHLRLFWNLVLA